MANSGKFHCCQCERKENKKYTKKLVEKLKENTIAAHHSGDMTWKSGLRLFLAMFLLAFCHSCVLAVWLCGTIKDQRWSFIYTTVLLFIWISEIKANSSSSQARLFATIAISGMRFDLHPKLKCLSKLFPNFLNAFLTSLFFIELSLKTCSTVFREQHSQSNIKKTGAYPTSSQ